MPTDEPDTPTERIIRNHERFPSLEEFVIALCAANRINLTELASMLGYSEPSNVRNAMRGGSRSQYRVAHLIWNHPDNVLHLPHSGPEGAMAEEALFSKTPRGHQLTSQRLAGLRAEIAESVRRIVREDGPRPQLQTVLRQLFPEELYDVNKIAGLHPVRVQSILSKGTPNDRELAQMLAAAELPIDVYFDDFRSLPSGYVRTETLFSRCLRDCLHDTGRTLREIAAVSRHPFIDPAGEGVSHSVLSRLSTGSANQPEQHTVYVIARTLAYLATQRVPSSAADLPPGIRRMVDNADYKGKTAGIDPFADSHAILAAADAQTADIFPLLKAMRLAPDINTSIARIAEHIAPNDAANLRAAYHDWEHKKLFPQEQRVLELVPATLGAFTEESGVVFSEAEQEKLREITQNSLRRQEAFRQNGQERSSQTNRQTRLRLKADPFSPSR